MTIKVKASAPGFYGSLREVGDEFHVSSKGDLGTWMEVLEGPKKSAPEPGNDADYVAARGAAGKFVIKDADGNRVGNFAGTKAEAEAEAERLIQDGGTPPATGDQEDDGNDEDLPDA